FVVAIEGKLSAASGKLNSGQGSIGHYFVDRASMNQQKWESAFFRECGKLSAGIRDTVDFAVGAREKRHLDVVGRHAPTSRGTSSARCTSDFPLKVKFRACRTEAFSTIRNREKIHPRNGGGAFQSADKGR